MTELLTRFNFHDPNISTGWFLMVGACWLVVVLCALTSVFGRPFHWTFKLFWTAVIIALPLVGLLAYLPFSLKEELYPYLGFWRKPS